MTYIACSFSGLCEPVNSMSLGQESQVGNIEQPFNALFQAFNEGVDEKWTTYTFPIQVTLEEFAKRASLDSAFEHPGWLIFHLTVIINLNLRISI